MKRLRWLTICLLVVGCTDGCGTAGKLRATEGLAQVSSEVNLGRPFVGDRAEASFPITAVSDGAVRVLSVTSAHPQLVIDWSAQPGGVTIARGATLNVKLSWAPSEPGLLDTSVEVELDIDQGARRAVHVTGEGREVPACDDDNPCTDDAFDKASEKCVQAYHDRACDDGNACTKDDQCQQGVCKGSGVTCDDDNVCTSNLCDPVQGCVFLPDARQCDDQDPCTTDLCDPDDGCSHEVATGPSCGPVSCATAHMCVAGVCKELDISGSSDGFPCSDGDACTEGDQCLAGKCRSGPLKTDTGPVIIGNIDTYGGENAYVTTDGFRYLFVDREMYQFGTSHGTADPTSLRIATYDGTSLQPRGALPVYATAAPVSIAPGLFVVPTRLALLAINATNPDAPTIEWTNQPIAPPTTGTRRVWRVQNGLLLHVTQAKNGAPVEGLLLARLSAASTLVSAWQQVTESGASYTPRYIYDLDADGDSIVISDSNEISWKRLDSAGRIVESIRIADANPVARVSLQGRMVAVVVPSVLRIFHATQPATLVASASANDVADVTLVGNTVFTTSYSEGTWARTLDELTGSAAANPKGSVVDGQHGFELERAVGHIVLSGRVALPLKLSGGSPTEAPKVTRVTGVGHGSVTVTTDGANGRVVLGGPTNVGEVDPATGRFTSWNMLDHYPVRTEGFLLKGHTRTVPISRNLARLGSDVSVCDGPVWSQFDQTGQTDQFQVCGLHGGNVAATPGRLWSAAIIARPQPINPVFDQRGLRAWEMNPPRQFPTFDEPDNTNSTTLAVRSTTDQRYVGRLLDITTSSNPPTRIQSIELMTAAAGAPVTLAGRFAFGDDAMRRVEYQQSFTVDEEAALICAPFQVRLLPRRPPNAPRELVPADTLPTVALPSALDVNCVEMQNSRAWISWEGLKQSTDSRFHLAQFRYVGATPLLENRGEVELPAPATSVRDVGDVSVAATNAGVYVIAPSCR